MDLLPLPEFHRCVDLYQGDHKVQGFSCLDQFLALAFAQLTYRESQRDFEACLRAMQPRLYHMGFRGQRRFRAGADCRSVRIKRFYDASENAGKTPIWIALPLYLLVAILQKRLGVDASLYRILQILSVPAFDKMPILQALAASEPQEFPAHPSIQLNLFG